MNSKKLAVIAVLGLVVVAIFVVGINISSGRHDEMVKRGKYLVELGDCNMCHTPKVMGVMGLELDSTRLLSGHPQDGHVSEYTAEAMNNEGWVTKTNFHLTQWQGPWGVSFAANLTPDKSTGIGSWSEDDFIRTIRSGRHMGTGRKIQLPMPWDNFAKLSDDDLKAIFAYLKSLPPVENLVPKSIPAEKVGTESSD